MRGPFAVFEKFRVAMGKIHYELGELLGCEYCTSTWVSALLSIANMVIIPNIAYTPFNLIMGDSAPWWFIVILDCLFGSGISWFLFRTEDALLAVKEKNQTYEDE